MELHRLDKKIILQENERFAVDELIQSLREERRKRKSSYAKVSTGTSVYEMYNPKAAYYQGHIERDPRKVF